MPNAAAQKYTVLRLLFQRFFMLSLRFCMAVFLLFGQVVFFGGRRCFRRPQMMRSGGIPYLRSNRFKTDP